jgi:hypothetical protein
LRLNARPEAESQRGEKRQEREEPAEALWVGNDWVILHEFSGENRQIRAVYYPTISSQ